MSFRIPPRALHERVVAQTTLRVCIMSPDGSTQKHQPIQFVPAEER